MSMPLGTKTDQEIRDASPTQAMEEAGVGFNPATQCLDLSLDEKRRTTALMLAINAYRELIIKDADYLREVRNMARQEEGPKIREATMDAMVLGAIRFDDFIAGRYSHIDPDLGGPAQSTVEGDKDKGID